LVAVGCRKAAPNKRRLIVSRARSRNAAVIRRVREPIRQRCARRARSLAVKQAADINVAAAVGIPDITEAQMHSRSASNETPRRGPSARTTASRLRPVPRRPLARTMPVLNSSSQRAPTAVHRQAAEIRARAIHPARSVRCTCGFRKSACRHCRLPGKEWSRFRRNKRPVLQPAQYPSRASERGPRTDEFPQTRCRG